MCAVLLELVDDSALFAGLFMLIGFFAYAWVKTGTMPSRGGRTMRANPVDHTIVEETYSAGDGTQEGLRDPVKTGGHATLQDQAVVKRMEALEAQVRRLVAREGQSKGLLGGEKTGRRARAGKGLFKRSNTKKVAP